MEDKAHRPGAQWPRHAGVLLAGLCFAGVLACAPACASIPDTMLYGRADSRYHLELLALALNGIPRDDTLFLVGPDADIYAREQTLEHFGLKVEGDKQLKSEGEVFRPLSEVPGATWHIVANQAQLVLDVPATSIKTESGISIHSVAAHSEPTRSMGAFFNYDLFSFGQTPVDEYSGAFNTGAFGPWGVLTNDFIYRSAGFGANPLRLDSTLQYDRPGRRTTLTLGDSIARPGAIGNAVRFGGIQYGTNFATQPYFLTFPQPTLRGQTALPSTVDVYIDNVLRGSQSVPAGGFATQALPVTTGRGTVRLEVRDALGRQTTITQPFFITSDLLKPGLTDFSVAAGALRRNFGIRSDDYGQALVDGLWRHGFNERLTGSAFAAAQPFVQTAGSSATVKIGQSGVAQMALGGSHGEKGSGLDGRLALSQQLGLVSYGASIERASPHYRDIGARDDLILSPKETLTGNVGISLGRVGSLTANYVHREYRDQGTIDVINVSYTRNIGPGFLSIGFFRTLGSERSYAGQILFTLPLGKRTTASVGADTDGPRQGLFGEVQRSLPVGEGYGYRLQAGSGSDSRSLAEVSGRSNVGTYRLGAARFDGRTSYQAEASGGLAAIDGGLYASRRIDDSFALVKVPGFANVRVYDQNHLIGRTNRRGNVLVPQLEAYQNNRIRLDAADLPLNADIPNLEHDAVPFFRSGTVARFAIKRTNAATFVVLGPGGKPLPAGTELIAGDTRKTFPIGYDGFAYVEGLEPGINHFHARWSGGICQLTLDYPERAAIQPDLGTVHCQGAPQ